MTTSDVSFFLHGEHVAHDKLIFEKKYYLHVQSGSTLSSNLC